MAVKITFIICATIVLVSIVDALKRRDNNGRK